ncbi:hypothetical protein NC651_017475 [Populus alba x Populus x berolinensis]|nr:hypothetical protein NC651_017475 [Populus alba x Populus x berolinensis]
MLNWSCIHLAVYLSTQVLLDSVKFSFRREIKSTRLYIQVATQSAAPATEMLLNISGLRVNMDLRAEFTTAEMDTCTFVLVISTKIVVSF